MKQIIYVLSLVLLGGCASRSGPSVVIDDLPDPMYINHFEIPQLKIDTSEQTTTLAAEVQPQHPWIPLGGLSDRWRYIVIHHTASEVGSMQDIHQWHLDKGWENGCGYHFIIGNGTRSEDGQVEPGPRWWNQATGAHVRLSETLAARRGVDSNYYNEYGIGIALVGNFDMESPSSKQLDSLVVLVKFLMQECDIPLVRVVAHGEIDETNCPGEQFSIWDLRMRLRNTH